MSEGWISLHRGWRDNPIFRGEFSRADAWVWLIENACWKPTRFDIKGKIVTLERGQVCASRDRLATVWGWSPSAVERYLTRLQTEHMIGRETGQGKSVITICNYAKYQDRANQTGQETGQETGQASDRDRTAKEQGNKGISDEVGKPTPSPRAKRAVVSPHRMPADWKPGPLPPDIAELVADWPPGRLEREAAGTRDYWLGLKTRRPGWDLTFHNRIRDVHDRIMREARNGQPHRNQPDNRNGIALALDRRLGLGEPAREAGRCPDGGGQEDRGRTLALVAPVR